MDWLAVAFYGVMGAFLIYATLAAWVVLRPD